MFKIASPSRLHNLKIPRIYLKCLEIKHREGSVS